MSDQIAASAKAQTDKAANSFEYKPSLGGRRRGSLRLG